MSPRRRRLALAAAALCSLGVAAALALNAFRSNLVFFYAPSQVMEGKASGAGAFRLGGLVQAGSVHRESDGLTVRFAVTDMAKTVEVRYRGLLPDLFAERRGVVAQGRLDADGVFVATDVLAKHDENYMPPQVAATLAKTGAGL
jgi:cytochrome c-type biogenesis protein CcmE